MKYLKSAFLFILLLSGIHLRAQQNHFIYIQTENKQPFYVKLQDKVLSSSASGYIMLSKLKEGSQNFIIGFPKNEWQEQQMMCVIKDKDQGYILKNFVEKGWGLFNLQTLEVVMTDTKPKVLTNETLVENKTDAFSAMLSNVVNDPSIKQRELQKQEEKVIVPEQKVIDTVASVVVQEKITSTVARVMLNNSADGEEMIFYDNYFGKTDTITIFIPNDKKTVAVDQTKPATNLINEPEQEEKLLKKEKKELPIENIVQTVKILSTEKPVQEKEALEIIAEKDKPAQMKFLEIEIPDSSRQNQEVIKKNEAATEQNKAKQKTTVTSVMINSDCKIVAVEEDFLKLRKKMAAEDNDDDMISIAKKTLKIKCFTVEQIKNLSVLFLKDSGKYGFFDAAYPYVLDSHNYENLLDQLSESYYINRFQVMIRR